MFEQIDALWLMDIWKDIRKPQKLQRFRGMVSICSLPSRRRSLLFGDDDVLFKKFEPPRFGDERS